MTQSAEEIQRDAEINEAARHERLRLDGARPLGENLEQADALIRRAFALAHAFSPARGDTPS